MSLRIIEYPELGGTHKVHRVQLLGPHRTTQKSEGWRQKVFYRLLWNWKGFSGRRKEFQGSCIRPLIPFSWSSTAGRSSPAVLSSEDEICPGIEPHPWQTLLYGESKDHSSSPLAFRALSSAQDTKQLQKTAGTFPLHPTGAKHFFS